MTFRHLSPTLDAADKENADLRADNETMQNKIDTIFDVIETHAADADAQSHIFTALAESINRALKGELEDE